MISIFKLRAERSWRRLLKRMSLFFAAAVVLPGVTACSNIADMADILLFGIALGRAEEQRSLQVLVGPGSNDPDFKGYFVHEDPADGCLEIHLTLNREPTAAVTIPLSTGAPDQTEIQNMLGEKIDSITIEAADYADTTANRIKICGVDETDEDGPKIISLVFGEVSSSDPDIDGAIPPTVGDIVLLDNDGPIRLMVANSPGGIRTMESGAFTIEGMGRDYFAVVLSREPAANVTFEFTTEMVRIGESDQRFEGEMQGGAPPHRTVDFTTANWKTPQTITVENQEDYMQDGDQNYEIVVTNITGTGAVAPTPASDQFPNSCTPDDADVLANCSDRIFISGNPRTVVANRIAAVNLDNYKPAITVSPTSLTVDEIHEPPNLVNNGDFTVTLNAVPQNGDVDVPFVIPNPDRATVSIVSGCTLFGYDSGAGTGKLRFAESAWTIGVTEKLDCVVRLTATPNDIHGDPISFELQLNTTENLPYNMDPDNVNVVINDSNWPGILLSDLDRSISEAPQNAKFCVRLNSKPTHNVTVRINDLYDNKNTTPIDHARFYVEPKSTSAKELLFTPTNWSTPQEITVTPTLNEIWDGSGQFNIGVESGVSDDPHYNGAAPYANFLIWSGGSCIANTAIKPTSSNEVVVNHNDNDQGGYVIEAKNRYDGSTSTTTTGTNSPTITGFATDRSGQLTAADNASWRLKLRSEPRASVTVTFTIPASAPGVFANNSQKTISHTFGTHKTNGSNGWNDFSPWFSVVGNNDGGATGNTTFTVTTTVTSSDNGQYGYADGSSPSPTVGKPSFAINSCDNHNRDFTECSRSGTSYTTSVREGTARVRFIAKTNPGGGGACVPVWSNSPAVAQMSLSGDGSAAISAAAPDGTADVAKAIITSTNWNTLATTGQNSVVVKGELDPSIGSNVSYTLTVGQQDCGVSGFIATTQTVSVTNINNNQPLTIVDSGSTHECYGGAAEHTSNACTAIPGTASGTFTWSRAYGTSNSFKIRLEQSPTASVTLPISCGTNCYSLNVTSPLVFAAGETEKTVWVASRNVAGINSSGSVSVNFGVITSDDEFYSGVTPPAANVATHTDHDKRIWVPDSSGISNGLYYGNFNTGLGQADNYCNDAGYTEHPGGGTTYKALLGTSGTSARVATTAGCTTGSCSNAGQSDWALKPNTRYYRHPGGTTHLFTTNAQALFAFGTLQTAFGTGSEGHWTGLNIDWTTATDNCNNFTLGTPYESTYGAGAATNSSAISSGATTAVCSGAGAPTKRLICVQQ